MQQAGTTWRMRALTLALALGALVGCLLDVSELLDSANLVLTVRGVDTSATVVRVQVTDAAGGVSVREPDPGEASEIVVYVAGVAPGAAVIEVRALVDGAVVQCRRETLQVSARTEALIELSAADSGDCGAPGCVASAADEDSVSVCSDDLDNDCDGDTDCDDTSCGLIGIACWNELCSGSQRWNCAAGTFEACDAPSPVEEIGNTLCTDALDNDCDGNTDCADDACIGATQSCGVGACSGTQTCQAIGWGTCNGAVAILENNTSSCHDGIDNDCDSFEDCDDPDCNSPACTGCDCP